MRRKLNLIHLYIGLFCFPILIVFGLSSLDINHRFDLLNPEPEKSEWEKKLKLHDLKSKSDNEIAEEIRTQLGQIGWTPEWKQYRQNDTLWCAIGRLRGEMRIEADLLNDKIKVRETRQPWIHVFKGLHFFRGEIPDAHWSVQSWWLYSDLAVIFILYSVIYGLWFLFNRGRRTEKIVFMAIAVLVIGYYTFIGVVG